MEATREMFNRPVKQKIRATRLREFKERELPLTNSLAVMKQKKEMYQYMLTATMNSLLAEQEKIENDLAMTRRLK